MTADPVQYLLPDGPAALRDHLVLQADPARPAGERVFFDTFDGRLHAAGLALVHEGGRLALTSAGGEDERAGVEHARAPRQVLATDVPPPLREPLEAVIEM